MTELDLQGNINNIQHMKIANLYSSQKLFFSMTKTKGKFWFYGNYSGNIILYLTLFYTECKKLTYKPSLCELNWLTTFILMNRDIADLQWTTKVIENMKVGI